MIPDIFNHATAEPKEFSLWIPVIGLAIVFLGINMRVEIKIQKEEDYEKKD